jgi:hypothetical protein
MGQYFIFVNPTKRQFLDAGKFNEGVKSYSVLYGYHAYAIALLVCNLAEVDHSYGQLAGSWFGDRVIVAGDDEGEPNAYGIKTSTLENPDRNLYWLASEEYEDISCRAVAMLSVGRKGFTDEIVTRTLNEFNPTGGLIDLGNVVIETGCEPLKQALIKGFGEDWTDKYMAALKQEEDDLS